MSDILADAAAGNIKSALIISIPTHLIESVTTSATSTENMFSNNPTGSDLLLASGAFQLIAISLLPNTIKNPIVTINITNR